jgi:hypothetical protein
LIRCNDHRKSTGAQLRNCIEAARQSVPLARRFDEVGRIRVNDPVAIQYDQPGVLGIDVSVTVLGLLGRHVCLYGNQCTDRAGRK